MYRTTAATPHTGTGMHTHSSRGQGRILVLAINITNNLILLSNIITPNSRFSICVHNGRNALYDRNFLATQRHGTDLSLGYYYVINSCNSRLIFHCVLYLLGLNPQPREAQGLFE